MFSFFQMIILGCVLNCLHDSFVAGNECQSKGEQMESDSLIQSEKQQLIDHLVNQVRESNGVPGIALAVIKDSRLLHSKNYGYANLEHRVPITDSSTFRLYSVTKPIVAVGVFQLVEKGLIYLDDRISQYVDDIPEDWENIQIKHLLSYSSGLPELLEPYQEVKDQSEQVLKERVYRDSMRFTLGSRFQYNQTDFWLLQRIVERVTGTKLSNYILDNQFDQLANTAFFSSDARDIIANRTTPYFPFDKGSLTITHPYYQGDFAYGMNGLHLTLADFVEWDSRFTQNLLISSESKRQLWSPFSYASDDVFGYGWAINADDHKHTSYGFSGSGCIMYRIFPDIGLSIIYLSNGFTTPYDLNDVIMKVKRIVMNDD